jgi:two-component system KDP operon response regulator KdpE
MSNASILVIDDESQIRKLLEITLNAAGYKTFFAATAREGLIMAANSAPELILLDLGLPDQNGQQVLLQLREWYHHPIIIISVKNSEAEIVKALDNGANDFLTKPFRTQELQARIRTALRTAGTTHSDPLITFGNITADLAARLVRINGEPLKLTATEYLLLALLLRNEGKVLTHQYILTEVWGSGYAEQTQYLRVFVAQLRKKVEIDPNRPRYILTESGVGYRFITS